MKTVLMPYRVPYADTDQMGFVYYANYLVLFERSRNEFLRENGLNYKELEDQGVMLPVIEAHCEYKQPARYDDLLTIKVWASKIKGTRLTMNCEVYRDEELLASGYTVHVCMCPDGRPIRPPNTLKNLVVKDNDE